MENLCKFAFKGSHKQQNKKKVNKRPGKVDKNAGKNYQGDFMKTFVCVQVMNGRENEEMEEIKNKNRIQK